MQMSFSLSHSVEQEMKQALTMEQTLEQKFALLQILTLVRYEPKAKCPDCGYNLTTEEILKGFNQDVNDFTTGCPRCDYRFNAILISNYQHGRMEISFYCEAQALDLLENTVLKNLGVIKPEDIEEEYPAIYHSLIVHCGSLKNAFSKIRVDYPFAERRDWKEKIVPFLGQLSDKMIADCVGVSASTIQRMRTKKGIAAFNVNKQLL